MKVIANHMCKQLQTLLIEENGIYYELWHAYDDEEVKLYSSHNLTQWTCVCDQAFTSVVDYKYGGGKTTTWAEASTNPYSFIMQLALSDKGD